MKLLEYLVSVTCIHISHHSYFHYFKSKKHLRTMRVHLLKFEHTFIIPKAFITKGENSNAVTVWRQMNKP